MMQTETSDRQRELIETLADLVNNFSDADKETLDSVQGILLNAIRQLQWLSK